MEQKTIIGEQQPTAEELAQRREDWAVHARELEKIRLGNAAARETNDAVEDLSRVRAILMEHLERTQREATGLLRLDEYENAVRGVDPGVKAIKLARAVRQSIVLQQELMGCRAAPVPRAAAAPAVEPHADTAAEDSGATRREDMRDREREDLRDADDIDDYDDRPYDQVMADIRKTFNIPAAAKPVVKSGARPADVSEPRETVLADAAPTPHRRERGPP